MNAYREMIATLPKRLKNVVFESFLDGLYIGIASFPWSFGTPQPEIDPDGPIRTAGASGSSNVVTSAVPKGSSQMGAAGCAKHPK